MSLLCFKSVVVVLYHRFRLFTALYFLVYFSSIVERAEGITRKLDDSAKRKTHWVGGRDQEKCRGCRNPLKKWILRFSRDGKFPLVQRRQKCHHLDNGWSWLHPDAFCGLQQLSSVTRAVISNGATRLHQNGILLREISTVLSSKITERGCYSSSSGERHCNFANRVKCICANVETNGRDKRAQYSFGRFVSKKERASADWQSEIQVVFGRQRSTFGMQDFPLNDCIRKDCLISAFSPL